ncbi:MAG TPA: hypothetical protein VED59_05300 [Acidimicrobiales bacterium]|nr:hypothetical protein [Acidimicrobiales bacterium]
MAAAAVLCASVGVLAGASITSSMAPAASVRWQVTNQSNYADIAVPIGISALPDAVRWQ